MTEEAKKAQAEYMKRYRRENRERLNKYRREWGKKHPEKQKEYSANYWNKKAQEGAENDSETDRIFTSPSN